MPASGARQGLIAAALAAGMVACDRAAAPSAPTPVPVPPALTLEVDFPVTGRLVGDRMIAEFPITVGDPDGPGGTVDYVEVRVVNQSRNVEVGGRHAARTGRLVSSFD